MHKPKWIIGANESQSPALSPLPDRAEMLWRRPERTLERPTVKSGRAR
jgi:hypothetical protein